MKVVMNEKRVAILRALKENGGTMTLAEISAVVGFEVKTGCTNAMVKAGLIAVAGTREIICPVCGHKHPVKVYTLGEVSPEANA